MNLTPEILKKVDEQFDSQSESNLPNTSLDFLTQFLVWAAGLREDNTVCHAGIFTGNDLSAFHKTYIDSSISVHAYDNYLYLSQTKDQLCMHDYVEAKHHDKSYITWYWQDVCATQYQYSVIYNTSGISTKIEKLALSQTDPCYIINMSGSSWHLPTTHLKWIFRCNSDFNIFCNTDEAVVLFKQFIKQRYNEFWYKGFPIRLVDRPYLWGNVNMLNPYKQFIKQFSDNWHNLSI